MPVRLQWRLTGVVSVLPCAGHGCSRRVDKFATRLGEWRAHRTLSFIERSSILVVYEPLSSVRWVPNEAMGRLTCSPYTRKSTSKPHRYCSAKMTRTTHSVLVNLQQGVEDILTSEHKLDPASTDALHAQRQTEKARLRNVDVHYSWRVTQPNIVALDWPLP